MHYIYYDYYYFYDYILYLYCTRSYLRVTLAGLLLKPSSYFLVLEEKKLHFSMAPSYPSLLGAL